MSTTRVTDPVCGMTIDAEAAAATRDANGQRYYFCSAACAEAFDREPNRYTSGAADPGSR